VWAVRDGIESWQPLWAAFDYTGSMVVGTYPPSWGAGRAYDHTPDVTGGVAPYTFAVTDGAIPSELTLDTDTGRLYGTSPTTESSYDFTITCTDSSPSPITGDSVNTVAFHQDALVAYTKLVMGFEGTDGSTTFVDEFYPARTFTVVGNAQIDTEGWSAFGTGALLLDGAGDRLQTSVTGPGTSDFCVECWASMTAAGGILGWAQASSYYHRCLMYINSSNLRLSFAMEDVGGGLFTNAVGVDMTDDTPRHVAVSREGNVMRIFIDGVMYSEVDQGRKENITGTTVNFGLIYTGGTNDYAAGRIDEARITVGHARYTADFTVPDYPHPLT
jgi:Concanavalin A-like lectin/glucanases superfamily/Putative Ig domain